MLYSWHQKIKQDIRTSDLQLVTKTPRFHIYHSVLTAVLLNTLYRKKTCMYWWHVQLVTILLIYATPFRNNFFADYKLIIATKKASIIN